MNTIDYYALGLVVGVICALVLFAVLYSVRKRKHGGAEKKYDERQIVARGQAYKYGFFTVLLYDLIYAMVSEILGVVWCDTYTGLFLGALVGMAVFCVTAIHKDAYLALNENTKSWVTMGAIIISANLFGGVAGMVNGTFIRDGKLGPNSISFFVAVLWAVIVVVQLVHSRRRAAGEADEDDEA